MTIPYVPVKFENVMTKDAFAIYLELCILWNKDIRDNSFNDFDRRCKQGQIDLLQGMVDEMDGIKKQTIDEWLAEQMLLIDEGE